IGLGLVGDFVSGLTGIGASTASGFPTHESENIQRMTGQPKPDFPRGVAAAAVRAIIAAGYTQLGQLDGIPASELNSYMAWHRGIGSDTRGPQTARHVPPVDRAGQISSAVQGDALPYGAITWHQPDGSQARLKRPASEVSCAAHGLGRSTATLVVL